MVGCRSVLRVKSAAEVTVEEGNSAARLMSLARSAACEMLGLVTIASVVMYSPAPPPKFARLGMTDDHPVRCGGTNGEVNVLFVPNEEWEGGVNGYGGKDVLLSTGCCTIGPGCWHDEGFGGNAQRGGGTVLVTFAYACVGSTKFRLPVVLPFKGPHDMSLIC